MKIGVVGLGYVGLPLAVAFCKAGHEVTGVDTDARVVEALSSGRSHVEDVPDESLAGIASRLHPTTRYHDEFVPELPEHGLRSEWPEDVDCAVIVTAHPSLDLERVVREAPLVVDFRGVTRGIEAPNLVRL
jgi:UDP-N-acetyl-D-mannosaminuronate dehydrogenase